MIALFETPIATAPKAVASLFDPSAKPPLLDKLPFPIEIEYLPKTQDDPMCRKPIIDKAEKLFNFTCSTNLEYGLKQLWNYFSEK